MSDVVVETRRGLTPAEVEASRTAHGWNILTPPPRDPWWKQYLEKFDDPVIRILMIAAVLAVSIGAVEGKVAVEGIGIVVAIFLATFLAFWNEYRANREFDVLNQSNDDLPITVTRDGRVTTIPRREVVVGDLVHIETGEEVSADGRVIEAVGLKVSEAKLTGEARPVTKRVEGGDNDGGTISMDKANRGSVVIDGYGVIEVTAVGDKTEYGKTLIDSISESNKKRTLNAQLAKLSKIIGVVGFSIAVLVFVALVGASVLSGSLALTAGHWVVLAVGTIGVAVALVLVWAPVVYDGFELLGWNVPQPSWLGGDEDEEGDDNSSGGSWIAAAKPWLIAAILGAAVFLGGVAAGIAAGVVSDHPTEWMSRAAVQEFLRDFMIAVTIIVVAVPEGLAMSVTLSLAYSMRKMTASNTLVRRMDACETIGAVTVICSDKTGTLTQNEMRVYEVAIGSTTGTAGGIEPAELRPLVAECLAANSTAQIVRDPGQPARPVGNPTEGALLLWLEQAELDWPRSRAQFDVVTQWTFNTERKLMGTLGNSPVLNQQVLHVKGAPEIVLARCEALATSDGHRLLTDSDRTALKSSLENYQSRGMRTLGFAYRTEPPNSSQVEDLATSMVWLGFAAISDPIRAEVPPAILACDAAGVQVKIVTGDNSETAQEIARQIGLWKPEDSPASHRTGADFAALSDTEAAETAGKLKVLSRARPADKLRLVQLLKTQGEVVAVTGDGVNDGPALNHADVGLAMGKTGTAVAKEASDIILLDESFRSVSTAMLWGRALYENIQRFIQFQLTINVVALGIAVLGPFIGFALPLTVMQMLWVNLIMDTFAALALATEPPHAELLNRPPRSPSAFIITKKMAQSIFGVGAIFLAILIGMIWWLGVTSEKDVEHATRGGTLIFTVFVMLQFWNLFNAKCMGRGGSVLVSLTNNLSFLAIAAAILVGQIVIVQFGGTAFRTVPLSMVDWLIITGATSVVLWTGEIVRLFGRK